jgi:hypothetical protein
VSSTFQAFTNDHLKGNRHNIFNFYSLPLIEFFCGENRLNVIFYVVVGGGGDNPF